MTPQQDIERIAVWMGWHQEKHRITGDIEWRDINGHTKALVYGAVGRAGFNPFTRNDDAALVRRAAEEHGWEWRTGCEAGFYHAFIFADEVTHEYPSSETEYGAFMNALLAAIEAEGETFMNALLAAIEAEVEKR